MNDRSYVSATSDRPLLGVPIDAHLRRVAAGNAANEAVVSIHQRRRLTYADLFAEVDRLAAGLLALGLGPGARVGIWSPNNIEWLLLQLATARSGTVLVNINPAYRPAELEHALVAARVNALFVMPAFRRSRYVDIVRSLIPECQSGPPTLLASSRFPELRHLVVFDPDDIGATLRPAAGFWTWPEVMAAGEALPASDLERRAVALDVDDPINIQFTSGTTGFAKPVVLTHHNILNNGAAIGDRLELGPGDRVCVPVPFYHCFGMVVANLAALSHGATIILPAPHFEPRSTLEAVATEQATALYGVPTMFAAELEIEDFHRFDLSSLRTGVMAGAPCPPQLMRRVIRDMGCREILIGYGQTEASPVTHMTRRHDTFERLTSTVGTSLPHQECKIADPETGRLVPVGDQGEVCFRGYHVMRGYFEQPEATHAAIDQAGWLHSGDLGVLDEDGYLRITGRLKDLIIRAGENIHPAEIEARLVEHPAVVQAAVVGVSDQRWGEEIAAWIELHEGEAVDAEDIRAFVGERLAHFKVPRYVEIVTSFPMTVTGKIQKFKIRQAMENELRSTGEEA